MLRYTFCFFFFDFLLPLPPPCITSNAPHCAFRNVGSGMFRLTKKAKQFIYPSNLFSKKKKKSPLSALPALSTRLPPHLAQLHSLHRDGPRKRSYQQCR